MEALRVQATLAGAISLPERSIALDALLASAVAARENLPPPITREDIVPIEIPIAKSPCGRFHLASLAEYQVDTRQLRLVTKRAPIEQYQTIGSEKIRRVDIGSGPNKSYRIPMESAHLTSDTLVWWCVGDLLGVQDLLGTVHFLGKKRSVGLGKILSWKVSQAATWPGFPILRHGRPLRNLPVDTAGLTDFETAYAVLTYPYWRHEAEELCAVPRHPG